MNFQDNYDCYFCVVDLHAPQDPKKLRQETLQASVDSFQALYPLFAGTE